MKLLASISIFLLLTVSIASVSSAQTVETISFPNGDIYVGYAVNGTPEGRGTRIEANGNTYVGEWKNGKRSGLGIYTLSGGAVIEGEWVDDLPVAVIDQQTTDTQGRDFARNSTIQDDEPRFEDECLVAFESDINTIRLREKIVSVYRNRIMGPALSGFSLNGRRTREQARQQAIADALVAERSKMLGELDYKRSQLFYDYSHCWE